ncbi:hypothetical protein Droror1_Dr00023670 [Drosera rotundifolia]
MPKLDALDLRPFFLAAFVLNPFNSSIHPSFTMLILSSSKSKVTGPQVLSHSASRTASHEPRVNTLTEAVKTIPCMLQQNDGHTALIQIRPLVRPIIVPPHHHRVVTFQNF